MLTLYRAFALNALRPLDAVHVFFETRVAEEDAPAKLKTLLGDVWGVPWGAVDVSNCASEAELLDLPKRRGFKERETVLDTNLLMIGLVDGQSVFARRDSTLMLVQPRTLAYLHRLFDVLAEAQERSLQDRLSQMVARVTLESIQRDLHTFGRSA